jgi:phospholipase/lecithinase/hemolysin
MKLFASLGAFLLSGVIQAAPLHNVIVFGDSLSDNGNLYEFMNHQLPQSPPYYEGRFSNGPVWVEYLMTSYFPQTSKDHLLDYAVGGSGVSEDLEDDVLFTLRKQVASYLLSHEDKASDDSLFVVWIGANNYLGLPTETEKTLSEVNVGIIHSLELLVSKGAKHILLFNLPDLGRTPAAAEFDAVEVMSYFAHEHNTRLYQTYNQLKQTYPDVEWIYFDLGSMFDDVLTHPEQYGFTNTAGTCSNFIANENTKKSVLRMVARVTPKKGNELCEGYLFFDLVHPTGLAHRLISEKVRILLDAQGVQFSD